MLELLLGLTPSPIAQTTQAIISPPPKPKTVKVLTLKEKIKSNYYKCNTETSFIRADNARCLPKPKQVPVSTQSTVTSPIQSPQAYSARGAVAGNSYTAGYCTAYAKSRRPDMPNNLGNADTWGIRAARQGFRVDGSPSVGAVAVARGYMHVAIVEQVSGGRVFVSEQNYNGFGVVSSRWASIGEFSYIH
jgi:surface antigen